MQFLLFSPCDEDAGLNRDDVACTPNINHEVISIKETNAPKRAKKSRRNYSFYEKFLCSLKIIFTECPMDQLMKETGMSQKTLDRLKSDAFKALFEFVGGKSGI